MEIVVLEDNQNYFILDTIKIDNIPYVYLLLDSEKEPKNVVIRKLSADNKIIVGLDNELEYKKALHAYIRKYKEILLAS